MSELSLTAVVISLLALKALIFVALVFLGVRLTTGASIVPAEWRRSMALSVARVRASVARARHYHGERS
jgi:hypothetical protein